MAEHRIVSIRLWPGRDVDLVDISAAGALVESAQQLRPGSAVELYLATEERRAVVRGRVLRCSVARLPASGIRYHAAVGFERQLLWFGEGPDAGYLVPGAETGAHECSGGAASRRSV